MKRGNITKIICAILSLAIIVPVSYAWLANSLDKNSQIESYVHKSYFESGDGTSAVQYQTYDKNGNPIIGTDSNGNPLESEEGCAFEIKYPVQLYYFAWLQALGYFNVPEENSNVVKPVYFYLSADLDMTDWILPQIGTQTYPFVGNFDGNGHTISNLTIQNIEGTDDNKWTDKPEDVTGLNIVGFFGVIGSLNNAGTVNAATGESGFTPTSGYSYNNAVNKIKNFALNDITINAGTNQALAGIVAGYVNGEVSNVRVGRTGSIVKASNVTASTSYTTNLSDYTLLGYVTDEYKDTSDVVLVSIDIPTETNSRFNYMSQGAAAGWGGSIDMNDVFTRIKNVKTAGVTQIKSTNHVSSEVRRYRADGTLLSVNQTTGTPSDNYYRIRTIDNNGSGQYVISYQNPSDDFMYLASTYKNVFEIHETNESLSAFYIQHNGAYLNLNNANNGITNTTPTGGNTKWVIDSNNHIYTQDNDGVKYYLNANNNTLVVGNTGTTAWTKTGDAIRNGASGQYLQYDNDNGWRLLSNGNNVFYTISYKSGNNTYYLNATGTNSLGAGASASGLNDNGHTLWTFSNTGNSPSGVISTSINGETYFLKGQRTRRTTWYGSTYYSYDWELSTSNSTNWTNSNGKLTGDNVGIRYNGNWMADSTSNASTLTITRVVKTVTVTSLSFTNTTIQVINRIEKTEPAEFTYIPLSASQSTPFSVNQQNTGYIIAGSHETTSDRKSDIRVSRYSTSDISSGLTNGKVNDDKVRTVINGSIVNINTNNLVRYADAVKQFNTILNGTTNLDGLHFMDATISIDNLITAPNVKIEGETYTNYQMPEDSIDFWVHQKGYITFFAGTYFADNNSFFSLHVIERSDDKKTITSIKEIKEIWKSTDQSKDYIYYLDTDGNGTGDEWSDTKTSDYSLVFNTDWITQPGSSSQLGSTSLFYFEIPVNAGEFALGSVEGRIGAYLLYLDIAANAQLVDRAAVVEDFEEVTKTYEFPVGATFQNTNIGPDNTNPIIPSALATLPINVSRNDVTVTDDTHITLSTGTVNYIADGVTVNGNLTSDDIAADPTETTTKRIRRTTYYDYNVAMNRYTVTIVTVTKIDNGAISVTINAWNTASDWDIEGANATQIANMATGFAPHIGSATNGVAINSGASQTLDYVEVDGVNCYLINVSSADNAQTLRIDRDAFEGTLSIGTLLYKFSYCIKDNDDATNGSTIEYDYSCTVAFNQNAATEDKLYAFSARGYEVAVTANDQEIHTKVVETVTNEDYTVSLTPEPQ